jgi:branched-subunit amino acid permease
MKLSESPVMQGLIAGFVTMAALSAIYYFLIVDLLMAI